MEIKTNLDELAKRTESEYIERVMGNDPCRICGYSATAGNGLCSTCDKVRRDLEDEVNEDRGVT